MQEPIKVALNIKDKCNLDQEGWLKNPNQISHEHLPAKNSVSNRPKDTFKELLLKKKQVGKQDYSYLNCNNQVYTLYKPLSKGGQGKVRFAQRHSDGQWAVVKEIKVFHTDTQEWKNQKEQAEQEVNIFNALYQEKENITSGFVTREARYIGKHYLPDNKIYIVAPYLPGNPLNQYLETKQYKSLPIYKKLAVFNNIIAAVQELHNKGYVHLDIKPENILYDEQHEKIYLIDFGCAKQHSGQQLKFSPIQTVTTCYAAPETRRLFSENRQYSVQSDFYSLGLVLAKMLGLVQENDSSNDQPYKLKERKYFINNPVLFPLYKRIETLTHSDPINREQLDDHKEFFTKMENVIKENYPEIVNEAKKTVNKCIKFLENALKNSNEQEKEDIREILGDESSSTKEDTTLYSLRNKLQEKPANEYNSLFIGTIKNDLSIIHGQSQKYQVTRPIGIIILDFFRSLFRLSLSSKGSVYKTSKLLTSTCAKWNIQSPRTSIDNSALHDDKEVNSNLASAAA